MKLVTTHYSILIDCTVQSNKEVTHITNKVKITSKMRSKAQVQNEILFNAYATKIDRNNEQRSIRRSKRK